MLHQQAKETVRFMIKNFGKYGGMLFIESAKFKAYRYSYDKELEYMDKICGNDEKLFYDIIKLYKRYDSYRNYLREIAPEWKTVKTIPYADNSVEEKQIDKYGNVRYIMVEAHKGDLF